MFSARKAMVLTGIQAKKGKIPHSASPAYFELKRILGLKEYAESVQGLKEVQLSEGCRKRVALINTALVYGGSDRESLFRTILELL